MPQSRLPHRIEKELSRRILVLDGATGTMIQPLGLQRCKDALCLTHPDKIADIHLAYLEAGADIIETNTFNANALSLAEYGLTDKTAEICRAGARIAQEAVDTYCRNHNIDDDHRPFVAGSLGPTGVSLSSAMQDENPAADLYTMAEAYRCQAEALMDGGVDLLLLETAFDIFNAKAAISGIKTAFEIQHREVPLMISATLDQRGRLFSGQSLDEFLEAIDHVRPISVGLNCGFGARQLMPWVKHLSEISSRYISIHPNAGLPDASGQYPETPEKMAADIAGLIDSRYVNIIGGCCGTTPEHIRLIAQAARNGKPRIP